MEQTNAPSLLAMKRRRTLDIYMLLLGPAMVLLGLFVIPLAGGDGDLVRVYAWNVMLLEILAIYLPVTRFIDTHGGANAFGLSRISLMEWIWALLLGGALCFLCSALNYSVTLLWEALGGAPLSSMPLSTAGGWRLGATLVLAAVIPAVVEETLLRGALLHTWKPFGVKRALVHTAALFALIHFDPVVMPTVFLMGLLLGHIALRCGSCRASMGVHMGNNVMAVVISHMAAQAPASVSTGDEPATWMALLLYCAMGILLGLPAYRGLLRATKRRLEMAADEQPEQDTYRQVFERIKKEFSPQQKAKPTPPADSNGGARKTDALLARWAVLLTYASLIGMNIWLLLRAFSGAGSA